MTTRSRIVEIARAEIGGSLPGKYWVDVLPQPWHGKHPPHWCGAFALWCLREAGLTDWIWQVGKGFLWRLPRTTDPKPGDIGYVDQPFQHHYVISDVGVHTLESVDGNQGTPGVQVRHRAKGKDTYFSIAKLLGEEEDTQPGPPRFPTLRLGATGEAVRRVQTKLNAHGAALKVDGQFGPATALAVQSFQRRANLDADGIVGARTWRALEQV